MEMRLIHTEFTKNEAPRSLLRGASFFNTALRAFSGFLIDYCSGYTICSSVM